MEKLTTVKDNFFVWGKFTRKYW